MNKKAGYMPPDILIIIYIKQICEDFYILPLGVSAIYPNPFELYAHFMHKFVDISTK